MGKAEDSGRARAGGRARRQREPARTAAEPAPGETRPQRRRRNAATAKVQQVEGGTPKPGAVRARDGEAGAQNPPGAGPRAAASRPDAPNPAALAPAPPFQVIPAPPEERVYPVLPLRGLVIFPGTRVPLQVGRRCSLRAVAAALAGDGRLLFCAQRDPHCDEPTGDDLYTVGSLGVLREVRAEGAGTVRIIAEGERRVRVKAYEVAESGVAPENGPCLLARAEVLPADQGDAAADPRVRAAAEALLRRVERLRTSGRHERALEGHALPTPDEPGRLCDAVAALLLHRPEDRQELLEAAPVPERLTRLHRILAREAQAGAVERDVAARVRRQMERAQREYYLREQLKAIQKELGEGPSAGKGEVDELRARLEARAMPKQIRERAMRELERVERMPPMAAEGMVARTWLEWIADLPWCERAREHLDLQAAERVLDADHHGLEKVKERILEHLALRRLRTERTDEGDAAAASGDPPPGAPTAARTMDRAPTLCLVGPPGAGKTSLARSVARALGRPFVRISLGGVRDEAEIRGHRRTYVGALPGRLITALRHAGARNPVMLLDEIDKMSMDYRGDPAAALLEVLDHELNSAFVDHYLELPFDLSDVLFIATANSLQPLARPLLDRLEVIALHGYGEQEKLAIARRYLLPRQLQEAALPEGALTVTDGALRAIVERYTREAGVRGLERQIGNVCRKVARRVVASPGTRARVTARNLQTFLGRPRVFRQNALPRDEVGVAMGLAWTEVGGDVLPIEVSVLPGRGAVQLTGKLGEVMRESAQAALTYVRSRAAAFGLPADFYSRCELHVHAPEGGVPKDGPSAGVTLAAALLSAVSGLPVRRDTALTGEITLRGRVLPVGGVKEKVLAAKRAGLRRVVLPAANRGDWEEIGAAAVAGCVPIFVSTAEEALAAALVGGLPAPLAGGDARGFAAVVAAGGAEDPAIGGVAAEV